MQRNLTASETARAIWRTIAIVDNHMMTIVEENLKAVDLYSSLKTRLCHMKPD